MSEIINRVAASSVRTIDLEQYYVSGDRVGFDLKDYLFQELVLKEKEFRQSLKDIDWERYRSKYVAVFCSADAIVPTWAFMLATTYLQGIAEEVVVGDFEGLEQYLFQKSLSSIHPVDFEGQAVVVKGCSKVPVPLFAYGEIIKLLKGTARSLMYGEPCSTVPLYKKPRQT